MYSVMQKSECVVLARTPAYERDVWVDLFTHSFGRHRIIAKGAKDVKSKFSAMLLPGACGEVVWVKGPQNSILVHAATQPFITNERTHAELTQAQHMLDFVWRMTGEGEQDPELFMSLVEALHGRTPAHNPLDFFVTALGILGWAYEGEKSSGHLGKFVEFHTGQHLPYLV
jgi:DNA repair protein RecO